jgi:hypothetical protein
MILVEDRFPGHPYAAPPDAQIEASDALDLSSLIPRIFAVRHTVIPLAFDGAVLTVAMAAPADAVTLRRLRQITGCQIQPLSATRGQIRSAIARFYRPE